MQYFWAVLICCLGIRDVSLSEEQDSWKGIQTKRLEPRITHGHIASLGRFPWQVFIKAELFTGKFQCGGSLIHTKWILTAAHCLENARHVDIYLGSTKHPKIKNNRRRGFRVSEIYMHPEYDTDDDYDLYDIALLKLETPVKFNKMIQSIKLANKELPQFSEVIASGWGATHKGKSSNDLLFAYMITLPNDICEAIDGDEKIYYGKLCAASKEVPRRSTCYGDSGGPLVYYNKTSKTYFLVGVTAQASIGERNCTKNLPEYFTDVYQFRSWIENTTDVDFD